MKDLFLIKTVHPRPRTLLGEHHVPTAKRVLRLGALFVANTDGDKETRRFVREEAFRRSAVSCRAWDTVASGTAEGSSTGALWAGTPSPPDPSRSLRAGWDPLSHGRPRSSPFPQQHLGWVWCRRRCQGARPRLEKPRIQSTSLKNPHLHSRTRARCTTPGLPPSPKEHAN